MSIWFYLFIVVLLVATFFIIKVLIMKQEIKNIGKSLQDILKSDTNNLITISTTDYNLKRLANNLNKSLKELRKLELEYKNGNQELKSSITNISHDLRTPLTAIRGYLDLMNHSSLAEKQIKYLKIIDSKVNDLTELTDQLFDFSKSIDLQNEIKNENICINDILEEYDLIEYTEKQTKKDNIVGIFTNESSNDKEHQVFDYNSWIKVVIGLVIILLIVCYSLIKWILKYKRKKILFLKQ